MPDILKAKIRKKQLGQRPASRILQLRINDELELTFLSVKLDLERLTKKKLTRAFVFREGAKLLLRQLRMQIAKAKKGVLHAKPRNNALVIGR